MELVITENWNHKLSDFRHTSARCDPIFFQEHRLFITAVFGSGLAGSFWNSLWRQFKAVTCYNWPSSDTTKDCAAIVIFTDPLIRWTMVRMGSINCMFNIPFGKKNWVKTDRTMWPYVYRGTGVHFLLHDQSKVQCTLYAAWNANNMYKEKRKIWLESTHADFLLIKLKNNFQFVYKVTHACILFVHSAIKCLTYAISFLFHAQGSPFPYPTLVLQCQLLRQLATQYMFLDECATRSFLSMLVK